MSGRLRPLVASLALLAGSCAAAVPSAGELGVSGVVRLTAPGAVLVSATGDGLPVFATRRGEVCSGDLLERVATAEGVDELAAAPVVELPVDCADFTGGVFFPRWSPDGTRVAFMGVTPGVESDIWVFDAIAGAVSNVSGDEGEDTLPLWIDTTSLLFLRSTRTQAGADTAWYRVGVGGGQPELLATVDGSVELGSGAAVVRTDAGASVIFNSIDADGRPAGLQRLDVATGGVEPLFLPDDGDIDDGFELVDVHPDGTQALVLVGAGSGGVEAGVGRLLVVDLSTGNDRELKALHGTDVAGAVFTEDGLRIVTRETGLERGDAVVVRSAGSDEDAEVLLYGDVGSLAIVLDGFTIANEPDLVLVKIGP